MNFLAGFGLFALASHNRVGAGDQFVQGELAEGGGVSRKNSQEGNEQGGKHKVQGLEVWNSGSGRLNSWLLTKELPHNFTRRSNNWGGYVKGLQLEGELLEVDSAQVFVAGE